MANASLDNLELLRELRVAMIGFAETVKAAISDADGEVGRVVRWLDGTAEPHWRMQIKKLQDAILQLKEEIRKKVLYKAVDGTRYSAVDEKKQLQILQRRLEEAERKLQNIKHWKRQIEVELNQYRGQVLQLQRTAEDDVPRAVALLDRLSDSLDAYARMEAPSGDAARSQAGSEETMARGGTEDVPADEGQEPEETP